MARILSSEWETLLARAAAELRKGVSAPPELLVKTYAVMLNLNMTAGQTTPAVVSMPAAPQDAMASEAVAEPPCNLVETYFRYLNLFYGLEDLEVRLALDEPTSPSPDGLPEVLEAQVVDTRALMATVFSHHLSFHLPRPLALGIAKQRALERGDFDAAFQFQTAEEAARNRLRDIGATPHP